MGCVSLDASYLDYYLSYLPVLLARWFALSYYLTYYYPSPLPPSFPVLISCWPLLGPSAIIAIYYLYLLPYFRLPLLPTVPRLQSPRLATGSKKSAALPGCLLHALEQNNVPDRIPSVGTGSGAEPATLGT